MANFLHWMTPVPTRERRLAAARSKEEKSSARCTAGPSTFAQASAPSPPTSLRGPTRPMCAKVGLKSRFPHRFNKHMKSSYELAMERLSKSSPTVKLTAKQKAEIAELE